MQNERPEVEETPGSILYPNCELNRALFSPFSCTSWPDS